VSCDANVVERGRQQVNLTRIVAARIEHDVVAAGRAQA
jgi:hypothetical protein